MTKAAALRQLTIAFMAGGMLVAGQAIAQPTDDTDVPGGLRAEIWLAVPTWPALSDLKPTAGGSFNQVGYGLGGAAHWSFRKTGSTELMFGIEGAVMATDSDIPVALDDLLARDAYLAASAKWMLGPASNLSVDAGFAYHLLDIAQLESDYYSYAEFQNWEEGAFGPFLGFTWDVGAGDALDEGGLSVGMRAHFLDFGVVQDEDVLGSVVLGRDAGELDGPMYELRIGYRWR